MVIVVIEIPMRLFGNVAAVNRRVQPGPRLARLTIRVGELADKGANIAAFAPSFGDVGAN